MLAGVIFSLLLSGPRSSPGPSRPWRIGTKPAPGRCPGRAQKCRPRARPRRGGDCPEERRERGGLSTPSQRREAFDPAPGGAIGASLGGGLGHPGGQPRPPALSMGPAPPRSIRRIPAALRPRRSALGSPGATAPRPARGATHLRRRRHPARARLGPPQTPARASPAAAAREGGARARAPPIRSGRPTFVANPRRAALARVGPTETFHRDPSASPGSSRPPRTAAQWTFPPRLKPRQAVPPQGAEGGT